MTPSPPFFYDTGYWRRVFQMNPASPDNSLENMPFACQSIIDQKITHQHIPDSPVVESERRQILFGAAIGIPTFFVQKQTPNVLMQSILKQVEHTRQSRRYPGYIRIHNREYRKALVKMLRRDAAGLIVMMQMKDVLNDLENRIQSRIAMPPPAD